MAKDNREYKVDHVRSFHFFVKRVGPRGSSWMGWESYKTEKAVIAAVQDYIVKAKKFDYENKLGLDLSLIQIRCFDNNWTSWYKGI